MGNEHSKNRDLNKNGKVHGKHENGSANRMSTNITTNGVEVAVNGGTMAKQNSESLSLNHAIESTDFIIIEQDSKPTEAPVISEINETIIQKKEVKENKEDQTDETTKPKQETESLTWPESVTLSPDEVPETDSQPAEDQEDGTAEENSVMNFFKTLVTSTKTKKETPAAKDQSQKENQPAATTTVAQVSEPPAVPKGMSIPPPPPPEPPKMEIKGEPAAKPVKSTPKEEPKAAAKEPESSKGKSAKDTLSKFFRSKTIKIEPAQPTIEVDAQPVVDVQETPVEVPQPLVEVQSETNVEPPETAEEVAQPVVEEQMTEELPQPVVEAEKVDPSKAGTLEATAKPEPPPPAQEDKKAASKSSFFSLFKPKAAEPKKATPAPAAAVETVKTKEEPKAAAKSSEAVVDNKAASVASQAGDDAANMPKKLEKRNSIQLFFKILGQKRNSTDAGVQTEPVTAAPGAEKAK